MRNKHIKTFYHPKQVLVEDEKGNVARTPMKPKWLLEFLQTHKLDKHFTITDKFTPFEKSDFLIAHTEEYVNDFFRGYGKYESNGLRWSAQFVESVRYNNANLYFSILNSINNPAEISFCPGGGYHHAKPNSGEGFCTFSGQVIASTKIYRDLGLTGAYLDLDGHYGNSIEDSRNFVADLNKAIPIDCNINPKGQHERYVQDLQKRLNFLETRVLEGAVHYLVWCHGADSHEWDDLGFQLSTEEWVQCSEIFYSWVKQLDEKLGKQIPLTLALFGGYRKDHYDSVLSLHTADLTQCLNILCGRKIEYIADVKPKGWRPEKVQKTKPEIKEPERSLFNRIWNKFK